MDLLEYMFVLVILKVNQELLEKYQSVQQDKDNENHDKVIMDEK